MNLEELRLIFISICVIIVITPITPLLIDHLPSKDESFLALAVLGDGNLAENYYPGDDPSIEVGEEIHWILYLYNHMGDIEYTSIKVRLLNSTMNPPDTTALTSSTAPVLMEFRQVLLKNETWIHQFNWEILNMTNDDGITRINTLNINNDTFQTDVVSRGSVRFRLVFELWTYDEKSEDFVFSWITQGNKRCAWTQIWFNVTTPN